MSFLTSYETVAVPTGTETGLRTAWVDVQALEAYIDDRRQREIVHVPKIIGGFKSISVLNPMMASPLIRNAAGLFRSTNPEGCSILQQLFTNRFSDRELYDIFLSTCAQTGGSVSWFRVETRTANPNDLVMPADPEECLYWPLVLPRVEAYYVFHVVLDKFVAVIHYNRGMAIADGTYNCELSYALKLG